MGNIIECKEPGYGAPVVKAAPNDTLFFPHVESCLAMLFLLDNGYMVGAHVAQTEGDQIVQNVLATARANAYKYLIKMEQVANGLGSFPILYVTCGNDPTRADGSATLYGRAQLEGKVAADAAAAGRFVPYTHIERSAAAGIDVYVYGNSHIVKVEDHASHAQIDAVSLNEWLKASGRLDGEAAHT
ncbi:MAG: hypothetical protein LAQ30_27035 [Acidobacteriia bacterium]|nr:hypothetical protein [Terriglobia bacterium]